MRRASGVATQEAAAYPLRLNKAFRLLPGRDGDPLKYGLPLRYAEGEETERSRQADEEPKSSERKHRPRRRRSTHRPVAGGSDAPELPDP